MRERQLTDCVDIVGSSCKPFEGNRRYISTGAVATDHIDESDVEIVDYKSRPSRADLIVEPGTLLFAKMQGTKKTLYVDKEKAENIYSTGFFALKAKSGVISTRCLYHMLGSTSFLTQKDKNCSGATQKAITNAGLKKIRVSIPDYQFQEAIADQLDKISSVIQMRRSELQKLDDLVKARFVEMFGDPIHNEKGWMVSTLGEYMTLLTDFSANGSYELLDSNVVMYDEPNYAIMVRTTDLEAGNLTNGVKYIDQSAYELLSKSKLYGGELIMNKIGSAGKIYMMPKIDRPASLGRNAFMFRFDDRINMTYLYALLSSDYGTKEIQQYVRGAVTKTITKESARSIRIVVPPLELQKQYAAFVQQIDKSKFVESIHVLKLIKEAIAKEVSHDRIR